MVQPTGIEPVCLGLHASAMTTFAKVALIFRYKRRKTNLRQFNNT